MTGGKDGGSSPEVLWTLIWGLNSVSNLSVWRSAKLWIQYARLHAHKLALSRI